jgi:hypothetical protein
VLLSLLLMQSNSTWSSNQRHVRVWLKLLVRFYEAAYLYIFWGMVLLIVVLVTLISVLRSVFVVIWKLRHKSSSSVIVVRRTHNDFLVAFTFLRDYIHHASAVLQNWINGAHNSVWSTIPAIGLQVQWILVERVCHVSVKSSIKRLLMLLSVVSILSCLLVGRLIGLIIGRKIFVELLGFFHIDFSLGLLLF